MYMSYSITLKKYTLTIIFFLIVFKHNRSMKNCDSEAYLIILI